MLLAFMIGLGFMCLFELLGLYTQGNFNTIAIVSNGLTLLNVYLIEILVFIAITRQNLFYRSLSTKVLADGHILIIGLDSKGNEKLTLYLNDNSEGS